jgi:hypothetical protein
LLHVVHQRVADIPKGVHRECDRHEKDQQRRRPPARSSGARGILKAAVVQQNNGVRTRDVRVRIRPRCPTGRARRINLG